MNKYNPIISIVTVVYNSINNIEKTLLSVINQTYSNIEYIIIDGGSSDGTIDIIKKYQNRITYYISEPDNGIYDAMNKSLSFATGNYIYFLNSGDTIYNNKTIEILINNSKNEDIIYGNTILKFKDANFYLKRRKLTITDSMPFCHQSVLIKRDLLVLHNFRTNFKICADKEFFKFCFINSTSYKSLDIAFGVIDADGYSNKNRILHIKENQLINNESLIIYSLKLLRQYLALFIIYILPNGLHNHIRKLKYKNNKPIISSISRII